MIYDSTNNPIFCSNCGSPELLLQDKSETLLCQMCDTELLMNQGAVEDSSQGVEDTGTISNEDN